MNWTHKDEWKLRGKDFLVSVSRHEETPSSYIYDEGPHRWCVYVYFYPKHPHFAKFTESGGMLQDAASCLSLHGYPSFFSAHHDENGDVTSYQVGADYNHERDEHFTRMATKEVAYTVFKDAEELFKQCEQMAEVEVQS